jgi:hypothetical protein
VNPKGEEEGRGRRGYKATILQEKKFNVVVETSSSSQIQPEGLSLRGFHT